MDYTIEYIDCARQYTPHDPGGAGIFVPGRAWETDTANTIAYINWRDYFIDTALTSFEWMNVPREIDPRAIELCLLFQGLGGMFQNDAGVLKFAPATPHGTLDMYYNPVEVEFVAPNGHGRWTRRCQDGYAFDQNGNYSYLPANCVCLFDNQGRYPLLRYIDAYARRIAKMDRVVDVNIGAQMTPWIARASEMGRKDIVNKMVQITGNEPVVVENEGMRDDTSVETYQSVAPFVSDKVLDVQARTINQLYTIEGIDNNFNTKKEREINSEVDGNNEQIMLKRKSRLKMREDFCEKVNEMFGLDMSVAWAVDHDGDGKVDMSADSILGVMADGQ